MIPTLLRGDSCSILLLENDRFPLPSSSYSIYLTLPLFCCHFSFYIYLQHTHTHAYLFLFLSVYLFVYLLSKNNKNSKQFIAFNFFTFVFTVNLELFISNHIFFISPHWQISFVMNCYCKWVSFSCYYLSVFLSAWKLFSSSTASVWAAESRGS